MRNTGKKVKSEARGKKKLWLTLVIFLLLVGVVLPTAKAEAASKVWNKINGVCYNGKGVKIPGAVTRGTDVSVWQGKINWKRMASAGVDFAFVCVGYDTSSGTLVQDSQFVNNMKGANQAGVPVGVYFTSVANSTAQAEKEAEFVISKIQGYKVSYPVVIQRVDTKTSSSMTKAKITSIVTTFCDKVKTAGYYPMIHSNANWFLNCANQSKIAGIDKWVAVYGDGKTSLGMNIKHTIWQATDGSTENGLRSTQGLIAGISAGNSVNIDFGYVNYLNKISPRTYRADAGGTTPAPTSIPVKRKGWYTTKYGSVYYYADGEICTGWRTIEGYRYYFSSAGRMQVGKKKIGSFYYYFSQKHTVKYPKGAMVKGWYRTVSGNRYYFDPNNGRMARNTTLTINGKRYKFASNGVCLTK